MSTLSPTYQEHAPREELREYVQCIWTYKTRDPHDDTPQPIAPDGRCEFILHPYKSYAEVHGERRVAQPPAFFAGQMTRPLTVASRGYSYMVGVRFHPYGARPFLGFDVDGATDKRVDLGGETKTLRKAWMDRPYTHHLVDLVQDFVAARIARSGLEIDGVVRDAVTALFEGEDIESALSERQLQRRFKREVGVSPRMFQSVLRFRRVFDEIDRAEKPGWVEAALRAGYFDQPQMARDFRRFLGVTAREWAAQKAGLATALTAPERYKTARVDKA